MTPGIFDFFKSFYYSNTYVPPVDLSEEWIVKHFLTTEDPDTAESAQMLISIPEVREVLSAPLTYSEDTILKNGKILEDYQFNLLSAKSIKNKDGSFSEIPFYSVIEHEYLKGWIIKSGSRRIPLNKFMVGPSNDLNEISFFGIHESILRVEMAQRIAKIAKEANIEVIIPKKKLISYANVEGITDITKKYCILCERVKVLGSFETRETIKNMNEEGQRELAKKVSTLIQKAGIIDASLNNIRLNPEGKLAFIDTEPAGLLTVKQPGRWNYFFGPKGHSVEKAARIGLSRLMADVSVKVGEENDKRRAPRKGLRPFYDQLKSDYIKLSKPALSNWKLGLSALSFGMIPSIYAIASLILASKAKESKNAWDLLWENASKELSKNPPNARAILKEFEAQEKLIASKYYGYVEGVPFKGVPFKRPAPKQKENA